MMGVGVFEAWAAAWAVAEEGGEQRRRKYSQGVDAAERLLLGHSIEFWTQRPVEAVDPRGPRGEKGIHFRGGLHQPNSSSLCGGGRAGAIGGGSDTSPTPVR